MFPSLGCCSRSSGRTERSLLDSPHLLLMSQVDSEEDTEERPCFPPLVWTYNDENQLNRPSAQVQHWQRYSSGTSKSLAKKQHWQRYIICAGISLVKKQYWKSAALAKEQHRQYVQMNDGYVWHPK